VSQYPSVGRFVHYVSYGTPRGEYKSECRAAVVTAVKDAELGVVSLCVMNPDGLFFNKEVKLDNSHPGGSWHWPELV